MPIIHIQVEGLQEMIQKLNDITGNGAQQAQRDGLQQTADFMANEMRNNAHVITGNMKASIQVSSVTDTEAVVECTAEYAVYENARIGGIQGPHDFADRAATATEREGARIITETFNRLFGNL